MKKTGMVLGKFLPPHKGHAYLINFAQSFVDELTVVVGTLKAEPIAGKVRYEWIKEMFPSVNVVHLEDENPQYPHEHEDFWGIWQRSLERVMPYSPDYVFASESYGDPLAKILNAEFIPCDEARSVVPVSGTKVRDYAFEYWDFIPSVVRPYFAKKVCIFGPESTGKSTLTKQLANYFETNFVPEYARTYLEARDRDPLYEDMEFIGRGQKASQSALIKETNKILFSDTDLLTTKIWSKKFFGKCSTWLDNAVKQTEYDLYLLLDVDVPWVKDSVRYFPEERKEFFELCRKALTDSNRPYEVIRGTWDERFSTSIEIVNELMKGDL